MGAILGGSGAGVSATGAGVGASVAGADVGASAATELVLHGQVSNQLPWIQKATGLQALGRQPCRSDSQHLALLLL